MDFESLAKNTEKSFMVERASYFFFLMGVIVVVSEGWSGINSAERCGPQHGQRPWDSQRHPRGGREGRKRKWSGYLCLTGRSGLAMGLCGRNPSSWQMPSAYFFSGCIICSIFLFLRPRNCNHSSLTLNPIHILGSYKIMSSLTVSSLPNRILTNTISTF